MTHVGTAALDPRPSLAPASHPAACCTPTEENPMPETVPAEELRSRYAAAIRATWDGTSMHMNDAIRIETEAVMAVRDDELARLSHQAERLRAAVEALKAEADEFNARHNPDCECEWGKALAEAARRMGAAMDEPAEEPTP